MPLEQCCYQKPNKSFNRTAWASVRFPHFSPHYRLTRNRSVGGPRKRRNAKRPFSSLRAGPVCRSSLSLSLSRARQGPIAMLPRFPGVGLRRWFGSTTRAIRVVHDSGVVGPSAIDRGAKAIRMHAQTPCQSRSDKWPTSTGWVAGGNVAKKQRKTDGARRPARAQSFGR